jgi:hypothetical protein
MLLDGVIERQTKAIGARARLWMPVAFLMLLQDWCLC